METLYQIMHANVSWATFESLESFFPSLLLPVQRPESCFPLNYTLTLSEEGGPEEVVPVQVTGSESEMVAEATGLKENSRYSATLSANNHFQFSIDDPVTTEVSFGGWSRWLVWSGVICFSLQSPQVSRVWQCSTMTMGQPGSHVSLPPALSPRAAGCLWF